MSESNEDDREDREDRHYQDDRARTPTLSDLFDRLGYNLRSRRDLQRLESNFRWMDEHRQWSDNLRRNRWRWALAVGGAVAGGLGKILIDVWEGVRK